MNIIEKTHMPKACFKSMTFSSASHANNATLHNERATTPDYLVQPKRDNFHEMRTKPKQLMNEIDANSKRLGRKLNARAKPLREAVILLDDHHSIDDVNSCIDTLENELNMRPLWVAIHEDEGHPDKETGEVVYNRHVHFGYTNYDTENHRCHHMDKTVMTKAQNIVADQLGMERGRSKKETGAVGLDHKTFRAVARKQSESRQQTIDQANRQAKELADENKRLREKLKASGQANKEDYQELNRLKNAAEMELHEQIRRMQELVEEVKKRNKELAEKNAELLSQNKEVIYYFEQTQQENKDLKLKVESLEQDLYSFDIEFSDIYFGAMFTPATVTLETGENVFIQMKTTYHDGLPAFQCPENSAIGQDSERIFQTTLLGQALQNIKQTFAKYGRVELTGEQPRMKGEQQQQAEKSRKLGR